MLLANPTKKKKEVINGSILCEVPCQKGNAKSKVHHDEEWEASNSGDMSQMRHQDVPNREGLKLIL